MPNITTWSPDTCECVIDVEDDWDHPTSVKSVKKCKAHEKIAAGQPHLDAVWKGENQVKNYTFGVAQGIEPSLKYEDYIWAFDAGRKLKVSFVVAVSISNKNVIQAACDAQFGAGKVEVT